MLNKILENSLSYVISFSKFWKKLEFTTLKAFLGGQAPAPWIHHCVNDNDNDDNDNDECFIKHKCIQ